MSKSLGTSPDPLDLIAKYGADGLRFGIVSIAPQGRDIRFQGDRIGGRKNFCNKLWNACRFRQMSGEAGDNSSVKAIVAPSIRQSSTPTTTRSSTACSRRRAGEPLFLRSSSSAPRCRRSGFSGTTLRLVCGGLEVELLDPSTKGTCLAAGPRAAADAAAAAPFIPFITEELWHQLGYGKPGSFIEDVGGERPPDRDGVRLTASRSTAPLSPRWGKLKAFVSQVRTLKAEHSVASRRGREAHGHRRRSGVDRARRQPRQAARLAGAAEITRAQMSTARLRPSSRRSAPSSRPLGTVDVGAERSALTKELDQIAKHIAGTEARLKTRPSSAKPRPPCSKAPANNSRRSKASARSWSGC